MPWSFSQFSNQARPCWKESCSRFLIVPLPWASQDSFQNVLGLVFFSDNKGPVMFSAVRSSLNCTQSFRRCRDHTETNGSRKNYPKSDLPFIFFSFWLYDSNVAATHWTFSYMPDSVGTHLYVMLTSDWPYTAAVAIMAHINFIERRSV